MMSLLIKHFITTVKSNMMLDVFSWSEILCFSLLGWHLPPSLPSLYLTHLSLQSNGLFLLLPWVSSLNSCLLLFLGRLGWVGAMLNDEGTSGSHFKSLEGQIRTRLEEPTPSSHSPGGLPSSMETSKQKASPTSCLGMIGVSSDPSRKILFSVQGRRNWCLSATEEVALFFSPV